MLYMLASKKCLCFFRSCHNVRHRPGDSPNFECNGMVFFDIAIGGEAIGTIVVGLFGEIVPKTVKNFVTLVDGNFKEYDKVYSYKESIFHRLVKGFVIQGGDITQRDGYGGISIYGRFFDDENFKLKHYGAGFVSMTNAGPDKNSSQFCIMLSKADHLDGKNVVFGKVLEGMDVVRSMEHVPTNTHEPIVEISITDCGSLPLRRHFPVSIDPVVE